nr:hypothetical protein [Tanacetum cinerariifolium]
DLFTYCIENGILPGSSEPSNVNTNVVNALREPCVVNQDLGKNSSRSPPQINHHCCYGCGDSLEGIFCHQCTCELCGKAAHFGYNCLPKVSIIPDPEPFNNQIVNELPHTLPSFDPTCYSENGNSFTYDLKSNLIHDSPNVFDPPPQPPVYLCELCGNDARYGHYCTPQHKPELWPTRDFEAKYNKIKAKLALLSSSASVFKASIVKNKGLIAKAYEWDEDKVSSDKNEMNKVKVLMALVDDENLV